MFGEVLFEFRRIGTSVKVSAVDAKTGIEVSIVGSASAPQEMLRRTALAKLRYVLEKRDKEKA